MFKLLRRGCPVPACKRCRRFFDDPRGHSEGCRLGPTGVKQPEHNWGKAVAVAPVVKAPEPFQPCPKKTWQDMFREVVNEKQRTVPAFTDTREFNWQLTLYGSRRMRILFNEGWAYYPDHWNNWCVAQFRTAPHGLPFQHAAAPHAVLFDGATFAMNPAGRIEKDELSALNFVEVNVKALRINAAFANIGKKV